MGFEELVVWFEKRIEGGGRDLLLWLKNEFEIVGEEGLR